MMRLAKLGCVAALAASREQLLADRERSQISLYFGNRQDLSMVDLVRPVVQREIDARVAEIDRRLAELGVTTG